MPYYFSYYYATAPVLVPFAVNVVFELPSKYLPASPPEPPLP
jgi:hypothetical protein